MPMTIRSGTKEQYCLYICWCFLNLMFTNVEGVMKIENIEHMAGIEPTSLVFLVSVLSITPARLPDVTTPNLRPFVCVVPCQIAQCRLLTTLLYSCLLDLPKRNDVIKLIS